MSLPGCFALIQWLVMFYNFLVVKVSDTPLPIFHRLSYDDGETKKNHDFRLVMTYTRTQSAVLTRATDLRSVS